jgi:exonuclease VII small subunit
MRKDVWRSERQELRDILAQMESGHIVLMHGAEEYIASLKQRIAALDDALGGRNSSNFRPSA